MQTVIYEEIIKIQPRGTFTVPKELRQGLFDKDGVARITKVGRKLIIEPVRTLPYPVRSYADSEINEFFKLDEKDPV
jgi:bifunctional DNA-binding transcriptional regulator/antitoxin component of YhaV-PrlF toxin-antitoxin module